MRKLTDADEQVKELEEQLVDLLKQIGQLLWRQLLGEVSLHKILLRILRPFELQKLKLRFHINSNILLNTLFPS